MTELSFDFFEDPEEPIIASALKNGREWGYWADQQLRDPGGERGGWFIEMGGLNLFNAKGKDGKVRGIKGKYVGPSPMGQGFGRFLVQGQDGADDGIYHVNVANIDSVKGVLSDEYLRSLGRDIPVQKEGVIDLSKTRIDPITQQDLDDANIEPDKPKNLRKIAEGRTKTDKTLGDLKEGDLLFDQGNDRFGEVVATTDKDGNFSPWVKWENNQISQIPDAKPETETPVWSSTEDVPPEPAPQPAEPVAAPAAGPAQIVDAASGYIDAVQGDVEKSAILAPGEAAGPAITPDLDVVETGYLDRYFDDNAELVDVVDGQDLTDLLFAIQAKMIAAGARKGDFNVEGIYDDNKDYWRGDTQSIFYEQYKKVYDSLVAEDPEIAKKFPTFPDFNRYLSKLAISDRLIVRKKDVGGEKKEQSVPWEDAFTEEDRAMQKRINRRFAELILKLNPDGKIKIYRNAVSFSYDYETPETAAMGYWSYDRDFAYSFNPGTSRSGKWSNPNVGRYSATIAVDDIVGVIGLMRGAGGSDFLPTTDEMALSISADEVTSGVLQDLAFNGRVRSVVKSGGTGLAEEVTKGLDGGSTPFRYRNMSNLLFQGVPADSATFEELEKADPDAFRSLKDDGALVTRPDGTMIINTNKINERGVISRIAKFQKATGKVLLVNNFNRGRDAVNLETETLYSPETQNLVTITPSEVDSAASIPHVTVPEGVGLNSKEQLDFDSKAELVALLLDPNRPDNWTNYNAVDDSKDFTISVHANLIDKFRQEQLDIIQPAIDRKNEADKISADNKAEKLKRDIESFQNLADSNRAYAEELRAAGDLEFAEIIDNAVRTYEEQVKELQAGYDRNSNPGHEPVVDRVATAVETASEYDLGGSITDLILNGASKEEIQSAIVESELYKSREEIAKKYAEEVEKYEAPTPPEGAGDFWADPNYPSSPDVDNYGVRYALDQLFAEDNRLTPEENQAQRKQAFENYASQGEAPVEEMAAPKNTVKGRDLKVGDVIRAWDENRTIKTIEPGSRGERYVTFETPGEEEDDGKLININDDVELARQEAPTAPAVAPVATPAAMKKTAADLKKGDSVVIDGETYSVVGKKVTKESGEIVGYKITFTSEDGAQFDADYEPGDTFETPSAQPAPAAEAKAKPQSNVITGFLDEFKPGDVLIASNGEEVLFVSAELLPPNDKNDTKKRYKVSLQRANGEIAVMELTGAIPRLVKRDAAGKIIEKVNRKADLKAAPAAPKPVKPVTEEPAAAPEAPVVEQTFEAPTSANIGDAGQLSKNLGFEILPDGKIAIHGAGSFVLKDKIKELVGEITRSGVGAAKTFFSSPDKNPQDGLSKKAWIVDITPQSVGLDEISLGFLKKLQGEANKKKSEVKSESGEISGAKATTGTLANGVNYTIDDSGKITLSGSVNENSGGIQNALFAEDMPEMVMDQDEETGNITLSSLTDEDADRAKILSSIKAAIEGGEPTKTEAEPEAAPGEPEPTPEPEAEPELEETEDVKPDAPTDEQIAEIAELMAIPNLLSDQDRIALKFLMNNPNKDTFDKAIDYLKKKLEARGEQPAVQGEPESKDVADPELVKENIELVKQVAELLGWDEQRLAEAIEKAENADGATAKRQNAWAKTKLSERIDPETFDGRIDGVPVEPATPSSSIDASDTKSVSSLISDALDSLPKDLQTKFGALKYRYGTKTPQSAEQVEKDHEIYLEYLSTVVPIVMQSLKDRLDRQLAEGNPDAQKNYDDAVRALQQELWGQIRGATYSAEALELVGNDRLRDMASEASKTLSDLLSETKTEEEPAAGTAPVNPPSQKQIDSITRRLEESGVVTPERAQEIRDLLPSLDKDTVGDIIKELDRAQLKKRMANGESVEDLRVPADMAQEVQQYLDQQKAKPEVVEEPTTEPEAQAEPEAPVKPAAEELLKNAVEKKASEINVGDRVFDKESQSFATVVGVSQDPDLPNRIRITVRFEDGREGSALYKKSYLLQTYQEPRSEEPEVSEPEVPDATPVEQDPQDAAEQGDSVPAEPGSVVVEEPAVEPEPEEVKPEPKKPRKPRGPRKPKKINFDGVPEKEKKYFTDLFNAYERVRRIEEKFGAPKYTPKYTLGEEQAPAVEEASVPLRFGPNIGEPLGIAIQPSTTDAINPENGYSVRQPTPGAFTGSVADLVEGKTKSETRDIINGLKVQWFDTETTGISSFDGDPTNNDVVQVGIVTTEKGEVLQRLNIYINPGVEDGVRLGKWSAENLVRDVVDEEGNPVLGEDGKPKIEKVTDEWLSEQMSIAEAVKQIIKFMGPNPIIGGQNVPFDLEVLQRMLDKSGIKGIQGFKIAGTIDSKDLAESFLPKYNEADGVDGPKKFDKVQNKFVPTSSLGFVAEFLGFGLTRWHSADGDAEDAWKLTSSILGLAAEKDPEGTDDLMSKAAMAARYNKRMREFLNTIDPSNPSTAKQHGAVTKEGFGEYLDDLGMSKTLQNQIFSVLKNMTRGEAAAFIKVFVQANPVSKKQVSRKPININDVVRSLESLEQKKNVPLPTNLEELPSVGEDADKSAARYSNNLIKFLKARHPNLDPMAILSERQYEKILAEELPFFEEWYSQAVKQPVFRRIKVGNAIFKFEEGSVPEGSLAIITNALNYLQEKYSVGGIRLNVTLDTAEALNKLGGQDETAGVAWTDAAGGHIVLSRAILGQLEADRRPGRKGHVSMELATLIHEYGHIYHEAVMGTNFTKFEDMDLAADFLKRFKKTTVTPYGETSHVEKFAELFYDAVYSEMDGVEPAVPEFTEFMKEIAGKRAEYKPLSLIDTIRRGGDFTLSGTKRANRRELSPENTTPEFAGATLLTGDALSEFEKRQRLAATDEEAGYIPDANNEAAYQDFKRRVKTPAVVDDKYYRELFRKAIEEAKKDTRRYKVLKVGGTNSFIRWKSGDATPQAIQSAVDQLRDLEAFNDIAGAPKYVTLAKRGTFTLTRLFEANDPNSVVHGFSFANASGVYIVANPDDVYRRTDVAGEWFRRGGADAPNMLARTLVHEYAHGWARVILGSYLRQISQNKFEHDERFLEFMNLFPEVKGITPGHPISDMAHETFGESFAEYFNAAYWQINQAMSLPGKDTPLYKFIKFFAKYSSVEPVMFVARSKAFGSFDIPGAVEESATPSTVRFPMISRANSTVDLLREFDGRREFYRNGLTPSGTPTNARHAGLVKRYFEMLEADERLYYADETKENYERLVAGVSALKKFYDSLFFSYARNNSKTDVKKIAERISTLEDTFRSWTSSTPILNIIGKGNFHNQFVAGSYEAPNGIKYPIAYLNTFLTGETESAVAIALNPRYQGVDMSKMTMSDLMDYAVGVLIAGSRSDMPALTLNGALVSNGHRRRGIATALLNFLRQNNKGKILHPETKDAETSAWAQSVDTDLENYIKTPSVFEDIYGTANQDRHATNVRVQAADTEQKKISDNVLDAEALHYAGQTYGELFHPNLQDYTSEEGGGLGSYKSTVGFVSARLLSSIKGNDPSDEGSVARKVEDLQDGDGFDQPVSVVYNPRTGEAYVADGNHRVQASLEAGVSHVPTRVFIVDEPPAQKTATPRKIERSGGLPFPDRALEVHPYFVFDRKDLVNQDSPEIVEEMLTNLALWSSKVEGTPGVQRSYLPDPGNIYEQLAPGEFVVDKSTGKIYKVYGLDIEEEVNADGQRVSRKTGKIVVRSLEGLLDQMDVIRDSTGFNAAGLRYTRAGSSNVDSNYNDIRVYTDEIRDPQDFENVTDSFMKLSDQPILVDDTMFVVQRETGLKGRISGFVSEGVVRVDVLKGYDEDDDPIYEQVEMPVSEILPIQNQREAGPDEEPKNHSDDMKITLAQKDSINSLSSKLLKWGFISDEYYKAIQMSLNAGFITRSGASELYRDLYNRDMLRVSKIRGTDVKAEATTAPEKTQAQSEAPAPAPAAPTPSVEPGDEADIAPGKMSFEELLKLKLERSKRDDAAGVEEFSLPVTDSKVTKNQPTPSQILEVERRLSEPGAIPKERAAQILEALPLLNAAALGGILDELRTATLNKRIANDQEVSDVSIPEDYNTSKLDGYVPRKTRDNQPLVEESSTPEEVIQESEDGDDGEGIELSGEQKAVADHILHATEGVIFLTGKAGAGKSTLVREIQRLSKKRGQGVVISAPTGVAALNAKGKTLHATLGFPIGLLSQIDMAAHVAEMRKSPTGRGKLGVLKSMDLLIVDEISMVNADMIDAMDRMLRIVRGEMSKPFGGAKILMVGDPAQLSPVPFDSDKDPIAANYMRENYLSDWFFDANVWAANPFEKFTLTQVFRQSDPEFIDALNATREGSVTQDVVDYFNDLSRKNAATEQTKDAPRMVPTNAQADEINSRELEALEGTPVTFTGEFKGPNAEAFFEKLSGPLPAKDSVFKVGEPVMFVKNDDSDQRSKAGVKDKVQRWVNGTVGKIVGFKRTDDGGKAIIVEVDGVKHTVATATWEKIGYSLDRRVVDEKTQREVISTDVEATYEQIPLKPAWAITIHKSQGQTYDAAVVDYTRKVSEGGKERGGAFAPGQTYVALSRLRSPEGLKLEVPLKLSDFKVDRRVQQFLSGKPDTPIAVSESAVTKDFDPLKGFETSAELESAIMNNKITGPNGETLTVYQRNALMTYLKKIQENPNSADRIRSKMSALLESWFGVGNPEEMSTRKRPVDIDMSSFRDPAEKQALLDLLAANGIPYNLKYDSEK